MPLVDPVTMGKGDSSTDSWMTKLIGKKLDDNHSSTTFDQKDLPQKHRVVEHGGFATMDHVPDRLNVHLGEDGIIKKVTHG